MNVSSKGRELEKGTVPGPKSSPAKHLFVLATKSDSATTTVPKSDVTLSEQAKTLRAIIMANKKARSGEQKVYIVALVLRYKFLTCD